MSYKRVIFEDDMVCVESDHDSVSYHEIEVKSELGGELESIVINKNNGCITIRFKEDKRKKEFDENENYIKPLDKDKNFKVNIQN